jgi:uncharacterized membrane protein (UPF0127 family)
MAVTRRGSIMLLLVSLIAATATTLSLQSCTNNGGTSASSGLVRVDIPDKDDKMQTFWLEPALDNATRFKGLSDRTTIDDDGGMIFVFKNSAVRKFVMRDCPIPMDIVYIDTGGRVIAAHAMVPEDPKGENESDSDYENRLKRYSSRFATELVIELQAGMIQKLDLQDGDVLKVHGLKDLQAKAK